MKTLKTLLLSVLLFTAASVTFAETSKSSQEADTEEVAAKMRARIGQIRDHSLTLPPKEAESYGTIMMTGGYMIHQLNKGNIKPDDLNKALETMDKMYEGDNKLTPKEADDWVKSIQPMVQVKPAQRQP